MAPLNSTRSQKNNRPPLEKWYPYVLFAFVGYCIADLTIMAYRDTMLPTSAPPTRAHTDIQDSSTSRGALNSVIARNIFNSQGTIPEEQYLKGMDPSKIKEADPVPSQLPLNLIGTLVHSNPEKSLAAIDIKGKNQVTSYSINKQIEGMAEITKIERQKAIFRNLNSNRLEYIEMKQDGKVAFGGSAPTISGLGPKGQEVQKIGDNKFAVKRADILKYTSNISELLMQARAIPNRDSSGKINGFRLVDFKPDSIYGQLGLEKNDVIQAVNGTPVDSPAKAMELYRALQSARSIAIQVERGGRKQTISYSIEN